MKPTINVNINADHTTCSGDFHAPHCAPVLIPCPIPRSVPMVVNGLTLSVTIGGKTWAESRVREVEVSAPHGGMADSDVAECSDRWGIVRALLRGDVLWFSSTGAEAQAKRRDAVFDAICAMARAERTEFDSASDAARAMGIRQNVVPDPDEASQAILLPSAVFLERYVTMLIEQVGVGP